VLGIRLTGSAAFVAVCLVAVTAAAQAQTTSPALNVKAVATINTVNFQFTTPALTHVTVMMGTDKTYGLTANDGAAKRRHNITIRGLDTSTAYLCRIQATPLRGGPMIWQHPCPTQVAQHAKLSVRGNKLLLNGVPFFMRMGYVYNACPPEQIVTDNIKMGLNVLDNRDEGCYDQNKLGHNVTADELHAILKNQVLWLERNPDIMPMIQGMPELLNWPAGINYDPFFTLGHCNTPADERMVSTFFAQLTAKANKMPVVYWTDVSSEPDQSNCIDGPSQYSILWSVVMAGVAGFNLRTQVASNPLAGVQVNAGVKQATQLFAKRFATLQPVFLTGARLAVKTASNSAVRCQAWKFGGYTYVVAVNFSRQPAALKATLATSQKFVSLWPNKTVSSSPGTISGSFAPLAVHIYRSA
jgi:hypothetical protein